MGLFRPSRERRGPDPYYQWKTILFAIGSAFGLGGIFSEHDWLVLVAIAFLAGGVSLRWLPRPGEQQADEEVPEEALDESGQGPPAAGRGEPRDIPPPA